MEVKGDNIYNIVIVGTGATGSNLLPFVSQLVANKQFNANYIKICDGDIIENKNLLNQKFSQIDVGRSKAETLCMRYQSVYPDLKISYVDNYIKDKEQLIETLLMQRQVDYSSKRLVHIVVGCVDNNATRKVLDEVFYDERMTDMIYIDSGNGTTDRLGQVVTSYKTGISKQIEPYDTYQTGRFVDEIKLKPVADLYPEIRETEDSVDKTLSCSNTSAEHPQNIATNIMAAATIFTIINNIIAFGEITSNICYFNAEKSEIVSREKIA